MLSSFLQFTMVLISAGLVLFLCTKKDFSLKIVKLKKVRLVLIQKIYLALLQMMKECSLWDRLPSARSRCPL